MSSTIEQAVNHRPAPLLNYGVNLHAAVGIGLQLSGLEPFFLSDILDILRFRLCIEEQPPYIRLTFPNLASCWNFYRRLALIDVFCRLFAVSTGFLLVPILQPVSRQVALAGRNPVPLIADHALLCPIASGSYGEVWLGCSAVGTFRAVKIVRRDQFESATDFEREFRGLQRFEPVSRAHEGFVDILQIGRNDTDGWFYYVMELADDCSGAETPAESYEAHTLRSEITARGSLLSEKVVLLGLKLSSALAYLHNQDLLHRDVKPSNILFIGGEPKLADAGLVAPVDDACSMVGTIGYIAPEGPGSPQADIYALGKVLYESAFGKDRQQYPQLPPDLRSDPQHRQLLELNEIITKACAQNPRERYGDANALRVDLELLSGGGSVRRMRTARRWFSAGIKAASALVLIAFAATFLKLRGSGEFPKSAVQEVNNLVDQGNYALHEEVPGAIRRAGNLFKEATDLDPNFVPAYYGLATVEIHQNNDNNQRLRAISTELMKLAPDSAEAWQLKALLEWFDQNYQDALAHAKYSVTRCRAYCREGQAWAHGGYGFMLQGVGDDVGALRQYRKAYELYGSEPTILDHLGHPHFMRENFTEALKYYEASLRSQPQHPNGLFWKAQALERLGRFTEAIETQIIHDRVTNKYDDKREKFYRELALAAQSGGKEAYWRRNLAEEILAPSQDLYRIAKLHMLVGEREKAYEFLEKARNSKSCLDDLLFDPCWNPHDEWLIAFARKVGLIK